MINIGESEEKIAFHLTRTEIKSIICGLQWSINHHKSLPDSAFDDDHDERQEILDRHLRLKSMFTDNLGD